MNKMKLSSPWVTFYRKIKAMFEEDPEIKIIFDEDENEVVLYVNNEEKAVALTQILPMEKSFGNVTLKITVVPSNDEEENKLAVYEKAFKGNPVFSYAKSVGDTPSTYPANYIVFKKKVVQFFDDDLSDINHGCSTLYQEIAKDIFEDKDGIYFCTDVVDAN